jgi:hypothetical protein
MTLVTRSEPGSPAARMSPVARIVEGFLAPAPAERLAMLRILVGAYALAWAMVRLPEHLSQVDRSASHWRPSGLWVPLDSPPPGPVVVGLALAAPLLGLGFLVGWHFRVVGPAFAAVLLPIATLDSSWGQIFHTENLMVLHVAILALAPAAADALGVGRGWRRGRRRLAIVAEPDGRYGWPVRLCGVVVVITYVTAGLAKLRHSGLAWANGEALRHLVAYDNLRKQLLGDRYSPVGSWLVGQGWAFRPLAIVSLAVELGAWTVLLGRSWPGWQRRGPSTWASCSSWRSSSPTR